MLGLIINSIIRGENPTLEQFDNLAKEIESDNTFEGIPRRFIVQTSQIGRFTIDRTKSIILGNTIYSLYEHKQNLSEEYDLSNTIMGYEFHVSKSKVTKVYKKNNPIFFDGAVELLTKQTRYI